MDALEINILLDTFTVKGKESGAVAVLRRDRTTKFDTSMFTDEEQKQLSELLRDNVIVNYFGTVKLLLTPLKVIETKEGTVRGEKVILQDSMFHGFLVTTNSKGNVVKLKKNGKTCRGGTGQLMKFFQSNL